MAGSGRWLGDLMLCTVRDPDGFSCVLRPGHEGPHQWLRCQETIDGYRCFLPPEHPGPHEVPWFAGRTEPGARHEVHYAGSERAATMTATRDTAVFAAHNWYPVARRYEASPPGLVERVREAISGDGPGRLTVVFEYRPNGPAPDDIDLDA